MTHDLQKLLQFTKPGANHTQQKLGFCHDGSNGRETDFEVKADDFAFNVSNVLVA